MTAGAPLGPHGERAANLATKRSCRPPRSISKRAKPGPGRKPDAGGGSSSGPAREKLEKSSATSAAPSGPLCVREEARVTSARLAGSLARCRSANLSRGQDGGRRRRLSGRKLIKS